jgi:hypothetical protein
LPALPGPGGPVVQVCFNMTCPFFISLVHLP